jgi:hypothetical protein
MARSLPRERGELGGQFSEGWKYLAAWLVVVASVCSVVAQPQGWQRRQRRACWGGVPGARATSGGDGGTRVGCGGLMEYSGGGQHVYLGGPGESRLYGWWRRLVLCGGGGSCRVAASAAAQNVSGTGHPGHELRSAAATAALRSCSGQRSGGVGQLVGQGREGRRRELAVAG